jgi:hypothetical protein
MILYALCLNPFLSILEKKFSGIHISQYGPPAKVVAYADDDEVTIFVTSPADIPIIQETLRSYEDA